MPVEKKEEAKTIELWPGKEVKLERPELFKDFDFICDLRKARADQDVATFVSMLFVPIGGEQVLEEVRQHIIAEKGFFDAEELFKIVERINEAFPKAPLSAQKRW